MKGFVFWTGVVNFSFGLAFMFPSIASSIGSTAPHTLWAQLMGVILVFLGIIVMFCAQDLQRYAPIICWEAGLRIAGFLVMTWHGIIGDAGLSVFYSGVLDGFVGIVYLIGVPRAVGLSLRQLMFGFLDLEFTP